MCIMNDDDDTRERPDQSFHIVDPKEFRETMRAEATNHSTAGTASMDFDQWIDTTLRVLGTLKYNGVKPNRDVDVLAAKSSTASQAPGTLWAKEVCGRHVAEYDKLNDRGMRREKGNKLSDVLEEIKEGRPAGQKQRSSSRKKPRFLKQIWVPMNDAEARFKTGHLLRDHPKSRRPSKGNSSVGSKKASKQPPSKKRRRDDDPQFISSSSTLKPPPPVVDQGDYEEPHSSIGSDLSLDFDDADAEEV